MAKDNAELAVRLQQAGARMTPLAFDKTIAGIYETNKKRLIQFAGDEKTAQKYMSALIYSASRNPALIEADPMSLFDCCLQAAQLGLWPGALQQCAFVPFKGKATFMPMVAGLIALAYRSGAVQSIQARIVYEADEFDYQLGDEEYLKHRPFLGPEEERGQPICVYAVIKMERGKIIEVKSLDWVESIRRQSRSGSRDDIASPWKSHYDEMAVKSVLKQALKRAPKDEMLARALEADNEEERPELIKAKVVPLDDPFSGGEDSPLANGPEKAGAGSA